LPSYPRIGSSKPRAAAENFLTLWIAASISNPGKFFLYVWQHDLIFADYRISLLVASYHITEQRIDW